MKKFLPLHPQTRNNTSGHKKFSKSKKNLRKTCRIQKLSLTLQSLSEKRKANEKENIETITIDWVVQEQKAQVNSLKAESGPGPSTLVTVRKQQLLKKKKNKITTTKSLILAQDER